MLNPFTKWEVSGDWEDHATYSPGGTDYPTPYGSRLIAPDAGTLRYDGWVGSAGRRATLILDTPVNRSIPASKTVMLGGGTEAAGPMVAIVFQHLSASPTEGKYREGQADMVRTGASANGKEYGGDVHSHVHGLDAKGRRLDFTKFLTGTAGGGTTPIQEDLMGAPKVVKKTEGGTEWMLVWPALKGPSANEEGYVVTSNVTRAKWWARLYDQGLGNEDVYSRADYIELQAAARTDRLDWLRGQPASASVDFGPVLAAIAAVPLKVEEALEDEFAEIPEAVADEHRDRLQS